MDRKTLEGKVALITGGSRGLGAATAAAFADEGAAVAITYVASADKAEAVVAGLKAKGVRAAAFQADQGDPSAAEGLVRQVVETFGRLDILVNNAAISVVGKTIDDPEIDNDAMDRQWRVNTLGVIANIRAAAPMLPAGGRVISIGSGLGSRAGFPGLADYAGSKAAVVGYSRGAARDLGPRGITVNVVQAGLMDTDMAAGSIDNLPAVVIESHAIQRYAELKEVVAAILFLARPEASYVTGSIVDVNGGFTA